MALQILTAHRSEDFLVGEQGLWRYPPLLRGSSATTGHEPGSSSSSTTSPVRSTTSSIRLPIPSTRSKSMRPTSSLPNLTESSSTTSSSSSSSSSLIETGQQLLLINGERRNIYSLTITNYGLRIRFFLDQEPEPYSVSAFLSSSSLTSTYEITIPHASIYQISELATLPTAMAPAAAPMSWRSIEMFGGPAPPPPPQPSQPLPAAQPQGPQLQPPNGFLHRVRRSEYRLSVTLLNSTAYLIKTLDCFFFSIEFSDVTVARDFMVVLGLAVPRPEGFYHSDANLSFHPPPSTSLSSSPSSPSSNTSSSASPTAAPPSSTSSPSSPSSPSYSSLSSIFSGISQSAYERTSVFLPSSSSSSFTTSSSSSAHDPNISIFATKPELLFAASLPLSISEADSALGFWVFGDHFEQLFPERQFDRTMWIKEQRINRNYSVCSSYPSTVLLPASCNVQSFKKLAKKLSVPRFPLLCWHDQPSTASTGLFRSSFIHASSLSDQLMTMLRVPEHKHVGTTIFNLTTQGEGENAGRGYSFTVPSAEESGTALLDILDKCYRNFARFPGSSLDEFDLLSGYKTWREQLSQWLSVVCLAISDNQRESKEVHIRSLKGGMSCSVVVSLFQVLVDPYYRTVIGFTMLIFKEFSAVGCASFLSFPRDRPVLPEALFLSKPPGHFARFLQFLDLVAQFVRCRPHWFEFNDNLLLFFAKHAVSARFGNFCYPNEKSSVLAKLSRRSGCLFHFILLTRDKWLASSTTKPISPTIVDVLELVNLFLADGRRMSLWTRFFMASYALYTPESRRHLPFLDSHMLLPLGYYRPSTKYLDLSHQLLVSLPAMDARSLPEVSAIETVDISHNYITSYPIVWLRHFPPFQHLVTLDASHNGLSELPDLTTCPRLQRLILDYNNLVILTAGRLPQSLQLLSLSHNSVADIPPEILSDIPDIKELNLSHNFLRKFQPVNFTALRILNLAHNRIKRVPLRSAIPTLRIFNLSHNLLFYLSFNLEPLSTLTDLDLSHNNIFFLPPGFSTLRCRSIHLNHNRLEIIPLPVCRAIHEERYLVHYQDNPLSCHRNAPDISSMLTAGQNEHRAVQWPTALIVGAKGVGKTTLACQLCAYQAPIFEGLVPPWLPYSEIRVKLDLDVYPWNVDDQRSLMLYDFHGDVSSSLLAPFLFFSTAVFVIVINPLETNWESSVQHLLRHLRSRFHGSSRLYVLLVATRRLEIADPAALERKLEILSSQCQGIRHRFILDLSNPSETTSLRRALVDIVATGSSFSSRVPLSYVWAAKVLQTLPTPAVSWRELDEVATACGVPLSDLRRLLDYLRQIGKLVLPVSTLLRSGDLHQKVALTSPVFVSQALNPLIDKKPFLLEFRNATLSMAQLTRLWVSSPHFLHKLYLQLLLDSEIIFSLELHLFFIPMLLPATLEEANRSSPLMGQFLEYQRMYHFKLSPIGFMPRLQYRIYRSFHLRTISIWANGLTGSRGDICTDALTIEHLPSTNQLWLRFQLSPQSDRKLIVDVIQVIDSLLDDFYPHLTESVDRYVVCRHCVTERKPRGTETLFRFEQCALAVLGQNRGFRCEHTTYDLSYLAPDLTFYDANQFDAVELAEVIGIGGFGTVYRGTIRDPNNEMPPRTVAVKEIRYLCSAEFCEVLQAFSEFRSEVSIMEKLKHPNLIQMLGVALRPRLALILEYSDGTTLRKAFTNRGTVRLLEDTSLIEVFTQEVVSVKATTVFQVEENVDEETVRVSSSDQHFIIPRSLINELLVPVPDSSLPWPYRVKIALDIALGMEYLQKSCSPPVVHRDLRSPNVFLSSLDPSTAGDLTLVHARVADFGLSRFLHSASIGGHLATWPWLAPEILDLESNTYDERSDIYSYGIILWEISSRKLPFLEDYWDRYYHKSGFDKHSCVSAIVFENLRPPIPEGIPPEFQQIIESCWCSNPAERMDFSRIVNKLRRLLALLIKESNSSPDGKEDDSTTLSEISESFYYSSSTSSSSSSSSSSTSTSTSTSSSSSSSSDQSEGNIQIPTTASAELIKSVKFNEAWGAALCMGLLVGEETLLACGFSCGVLAFFQISEENPQPEYVSSFEITAEQVPLVAMSVASDRKIFLASTLGDIYLFRRKRNGRPLIMRTRLSPHKTQISGLHLLDDWLVSSDLSGLAVFWDLETLEEKEYQQFDGPIFSLAVVANSQVWFGCNGQIIRFEKPTDRSGFRLLTPHLQFPSNEDIPAMIVAENQLVWAASASNLAVWSPEGILHESFPWSPFFALTSLVYSPYHQLVFSGDLAGRFGLWDARRFSLISTLPTKDVIRCLCPFHSIITVGTPSAISVFSFVFPVKK